MESFCDNHWLQEINMPTYVPVVTMETMICSTNWTAMVTSVVSAVDTSYVANEVGALHDHVYNICNIVYKFK